MDGDVRVWRPGGLAGVECLRARHLEMRFARHFHEGYALGVIESGALGFRYLGQDCLAGAGSLNMVVPGEIHDGHPASREGFTYRMFYLEAAVVERAAGELAERDRFEPSFPGGVIEDPALADALRALSLDLELCRTTLLERQERLAGVLAAWIARHAGGPAPRAGSEPRAVSLARDYLRAHAARPVSLAELSRAAGLSGHHLTRVFSRIVGMPPHAYQVVLRVQAAGRLLAAGAAPAEAALAAGFSDQSHLNRHFRRVYGVTPGAYGKIVQDA